MSCPQAKLNKAGIFIYLAPFNNKAKQSSLHKASKALRKEMQDNIIHIEIGFKAKLKDNKRIKQIIQETPTETFKSCLKGHFCSSAFGPE